MKIVPLIAFSIRNVMAETAMTVDITRLFLFPVT